MELELRGVGFEVTGGNGRKRRVFDGLDFRVGRGEFVAITGPNGSGKSVLARLIMGVVRPSAGRILLDGEDITELGVTERARMGVGLAFQQPARFKGVTVRELLCLAAGRRLSNDSLYEYLARVGLAADEYLEREFDSSLSGGEAKRVELAMVLVRDGSLMIFDEPEAGIDLWAFDNLAAMLRSLRKKTVLVFSHQERILELADRIYVLRRGVLSETALGEIVARRGEK